MLLFLFTRGETAHDFSTSYYPTSYKLTFMTYKVQGIIIGKKDYRDVDRLFTFYTFEHGKIQLLGQGTRKIESKLSGNLELLNHSICTIAKGRMLDRIATVDMIDTFQPVKEQFNQLTTALYCFEIFNQLVKWEERDELLFVLLVDFLEILKKTNSRSSLMILSSIFILRLFSVLGYYETDLAIDEIHRNLVSSSLGDCIDMCEEKSFVPAIQRLFEKHIEVPIQSKQYFDFLIGAKST